MPPPAVFHPSAARVAVALLVALAVLLPAGPQARASVPSTVLPGATDAPDGADVTLDPPVLRTPDGRAEVDLTLGADAPGDVTATFAVVTAVVGQDGTVTPGEPAPDATATRGSRVRPGERLRVVVTTPVDGGPVLLLATVAGATTPGSGPAGDGPVELATLLLPGQAGPPPRVAIEERDGTVTATVTVDAPLLVNIRLGAAQDTTFPDRLLTPDQPVVVRGDAARWPVPAVVSVTDEDGRVVTADTGRLPLAVLATVLVLLAAAGIAMAVRRHRSDEPATVGDHVEP